MGPRRRDPFEGVQLDESFVRDARFVEPSAAERTGEMALPGRSAHAKVRAVLRRPAVVGGAVRRVGRRARWHRRRVIRAVALVVLLLGLASAGVVLLIRQGVSRPGQSGRVADPGPRSGGRVPATASTMTAFLSGRPQAIGSAVDRTLAIGACLTRSAAPAGGVRPALCSAAHVDEVTDVIDLAPTFRQWPGQVALERIGQGTCRDALTVYLAGSATAASGAGAALAATAVYPDEPSWKAGARHLACTVRPADGSSRTGSVRTAPVATDTSDATPSTVATAVASTSRGAPTRVSAAPVG